MVAWVEILFPLFETQDPSTKAWFVDGGANQSWCPTAGPGGTVAPFARPHQIGTDILAPSLSPPPPPPPPPFVPTCTSNVQWTNNWDVVNLSPSGWGKVYPLTPEFDAYNSIYFRGAPIISASGTVIAHYTNQDLANGINAWFGSSIVHTGFSPTDTPHMAPICQGQYIIAHLKTNAAFLQAFWYAILAPNPVGPPAVLGAIWYDGLTTIPYTSVAGFHVSNRQTPDDPILVFGNGGIGAQVYSMAVIPSVNTIKNGTYRGGFTTGFGSCEVPQLTWHYLSSLAFSEGVTIPGFTLPNASGGTNWYVYMNHDYMDQQAATGLVGSEVKTVIQPAYPNGAITKINLGVLNYTALYAAGTPNGVHARLLPATAAYTIDNAHWVDGLSATQIPFTDEYHYISTAAAGGLDTYQGQPTAIIDKGNGKWWLVFLMQGNWDAHDLEANNTQWGTVRIFEYDSSTGVATQLYKLSCIMYRNTDIHATTTQIRNDHRSVARFINGELYIAGYDAGLGIAYSTDFARFF